MIDINDEIYPNFLNFLKVIAQALGGLKTFSLFLFHQISYLILKYLNNFEKGWVWFRLDKRFVEIFYIKHE